MSRPAEWRTAIVTQVRVEAAGVRTYTFTFDEPVVHAPGQHYEIRLTAEDGYQAARLYSAASIGHGDTNRLELTIELMPYGEISPYLFRYVSAGTPLELRGPFGGHFVWTSEVTDPVLLIGGGTGVVPLRAMLHEHAASESTAPMKLLYSVKSYHDMIYRHELVDTESSGENVIITFTQTPPDNWKGYSRRIDASMLEQVLARFRVQPQVLVCGPTQFVEKMSQLALQLGIPAAKIKAERFGPSGG